MPLCVSFYVDNVFHLTIADAHAVGTLLEIFDKETGLKTNSQKSTISHIHYSEEVVTKVQLVLQCGLKQLPINYLGLPLSTRKPTRSMLQSLLDRFPKITDKIRTCNYTGEVWNQVRTCIGLPGKLPDTSNFQQWWRASRAVVPKPSRRIFDTGAILVIGILWKERNTMVFPGNASSAEALVALIGEEWHTWIAAGLFTPVQ
ncbi:hypothetical protein E2562_011477 [Oryza meyeriana var. granulata]|uniref:Reverse transcriptase domain-containing protein n=1 Tax=Oryza meyeriana var. granulata TaxID=110450 RepID=A0A6G1D238_9ORYZ|nr:hypothetical protein E2562_011477 [Oryza meyeriana var. granulata]